MKCFFLLLFIQFVTVCQGQENQSVVMHYWDRFDFSDTARISSVDVEQFFSDYITLIQSVPLEMADSALTRLVRQTEVNKSVLLYFADLYERYLYESDSPLHNEELYIPLLRALLDSPVLDEVDKIRPAQMLELLLRNRVGETAVDFTYTLPNGQMGTLHELDSEWILLYFYDPDCPVCKETIRELSASSVINQLQSEHRLKILAVYTDEDWESWRNHISFMPSGWINSYDASLSLKNDELYDLKNMPTLYLLDRNKKVLLKNTNSSACLEYLSINKN